MVEDRRGDMSRPLSRVTTARPSSVAGDGPRSLFCLIAIYTEHLSIDRSKLSGKLSLFCLWWLRTELLVEWEQAPQVPREVLSPLAAKYTPKLGTSFLERGEAK